MGDPVQLPAIGGGAALMNTAATIPASSANKPTDHPDRSSVNQGNPYTRTSPHPNLRVASHQGVLESQGHNRGRGDRREKQSRENSRERSRRCDRSGKEDARKGGPAATGAIENAHKKLKKEHDRKSEDELMDAQGPSVYDLTQQDDDDDDDGASKERTGAGMGPYKHFDKQHEEDAITAPTPALAAAPSTPLHHLVHQQMQQQQSATLPPPWISDLLDSMATLHRKQDSTHSDVLEFSSEIKNQGLRLDTLEAGMKEHTDIHESTKARIEVLERQVRELQNTSSRSPTPTRGPGTPRRPQAGSRSPRSPHFALEEHREATDDVQIVIGGWTDARKSEAFEEVKHMLANVGYQDCWSDLWAPATRTNFVRVSLAFQDSEAHISVLRSFQTKVLAALKGKSFKSGIEEQSGCRLWATKNKSPEERARVRACVLTKVFFENIPPFQDHKVADPEIIWQGRVFLNHVQVLYHIDKKDPVAGDCFLPDNKGNHMEWFISASAFSAATHRPAESLQECYAQYGGSTTMAS